MTQNLFAGFAAFEDAPLPVGSLNLQYGLSTQVIEIAAEATVAPEAGITPRQLAAKYAKMFNMPVEGIVCYADGKPIDLDTPIPTVKVVIEEKIVEKPVYQNIEFRQPSGEKGNDISRIVRVKGEPRFVPMDNKSATQIMVAYEDTTLIYERIAIEKGQMSTSLKDKVAMMQLVILSHGKKWLTVGYHEFKLRAVRKNLRGIAKIARRIGSDLEGPLNVSDILADLATPLRVELNGVVIENDHELLPGDTLAIILRGETTRADFEAWKANHLNYANGALANAYIERDNRVSARRTELEEISWTGVKAIAKSLGLKTTGAGRNAVSIREDILRVEFPEVSEAGVMEAYFEEFAPELIAMEPLNPLVEEAEPFKWFPNLPADQQPGGDADDSDDELEYEELDDLLEDEDEPNFNHK